MATTTYAAFAGDRTIAAGELEGVLTKVKQRLDKNDIDQLLIFDELTGRQVDFDFRGTLGVAKDAAVGFTAIRLHVDLDSDATPEQIDTLLKLTERYCVIFQTLNKAPSLAVSRSVTAS